MSPAPTLLPAWSLLLPFGTNLALSEVSRAPRKLSLKRRGSGSLDAAPPGVRPSGPLVRGPILRSLVGALPSCRAVGTPPALGSSWAPAKDPEFRAPSSRPWVEGGKEKAKYTGSGGTISSAPQGSECKFTRDHQRRFIIPHIIKPPSHPRLRPFLSGFLPANPGVGGARTPQLAGEPGSRPVTRRRKNASDPTWARFRGTGNIWGTFSPSIWESTYFRTWRERRARIQTNPGLGRGMGREGVAALPAARVPAGELTGGQRLGAGRIKHLEPGPRVRASLF